MLWKLPKSFLHLLRTEQELGDGEKDNDSFRELATQNLAKRQFLGSLCRSHDSFDQSYS
jgi:hypothetical protein